MCVKLDTQQPLELPVSVGGVPGLTAYGWMRGSEVQMKA